MSYINAERVDGKIYVWERTDPKTRILKKYATPLYFYVEDPKGTFLSLYGDKCSKLEFTKPEEYHYAKQQFQRSKLKTFESDVSFEYKLLSEKYYDKPLPTLNVTFLDIEVDYNKEFGFAGTKNPYAPINAIAIYHQWEKRTVVYSVPPKSWGTDPKKWNEMLDKSLLELSEIHFCKDEHDLLLRMLVEFEESDALVGWNSNFFDIPYIGLRIEKVLGKSFLNKLSFDDAPKPKYREVEIYGNLQNALDLGGRLNIDYIDLFKKFEASGRPSYKLEAISNELLPDLPKLTYEGSLADQYNKNYNFFLRYNIRDTECLRGFEEKLGYVALANQMYHSSTGLYKNILGVIKTAEYSIMNYCHKTLNVVCNDSKDVDMLMNDHADGALVLSPKIGFHKWIGSIDINSLYPSAIRSLNISPETIIGQFVNEEQDYKDIAIGSSETSHTLLLEDNDRLTKTAKEWRTYLKSRKWAISGFGTVFDQNKLGVIPAILAEWYSLRKEYQATQKKAEKDGNKDLSEYYDRLQYCYKIKLNSLYGALLNAHFKFHDKRMGESTTGTGRAILTFQCSKVNELLTGKFDLMGDAIAYGDTDSTYFLTNMKNKDDAIEVADGIAELVNDAYPEFMRHNFLCNEGFDNIIKCGREIVASSGIFVTPKRYVLQMVNKDGKDTDKLKIMGLDTKKTILPKSVQDKLNSFIKRYLNDDSWDAISQDIVNYKDELLNADLATLGLPKGVKGVEKYTEDYRINKATRLPGHVAASILYNEMLVTHQDKDSFPIVSDMKIRVYYLKNNIGRFKSIALPTDLERVPKWFETEIDVDRNAQILRLVDNPLENILKAVDKLPPSKKLLLINEMFDLE